MSGTIKGRARRTLSRHQSHAVPRRTPPPPDQLARVDDERLDICLSSSFTAAELRCNREHSRPFILDPEREDPAEHVRHARSSLDVPRDPPKEAGIRVRGASLRALSRGGPNSPAHFVEMSVHVRGVIMPPSGTNESDERPEGAPWSGKPDRLRFRNIPHWLFKLISIDVSSSCCLSFFFSPSASPVSKPSLTSLTTPSGFTTYVVGMWSSP